MSQFQIIVFENVGVRIVVVQPTVVSAEPHRALVVLHYNPDREVAQSRTAFFLQTIKTDITCFRVYDVQSQHGSYPDIPLLSSHTVLT